MNLEEYKSQAAQRYPNTAFVEETLQNLKNNRSKLRVPVKKIGKAVGGISLLTAAAFAVLVGVGTFRGTLSEVSITEQDPEEENAILADREALYMTPLSNPNYTVRIDTENGKVAMNENTTVEEMFACGAVLDSNFGFVGYEQICNFFRAYRNGEAAELVIAEVPTKYRPDRRGYQYIGLNEDGTVNGMYYEHTGELLSTYPFERAFESSSYGVQFGYCAAASAYVDTGTQHFSASTVAGMALDLSSYGRGTPGEYRSYNTIPICTISDLLRVSDRDGEKIREDYFYVLSNLGEKQGVNILWNGEYSTPSQLLNFLNITKTGMFSYCSTTITDLTKNGETEECFYALEYLDGVYRIFTMKNGFEGEFDTAYFDGYEVKDDTVVFDNGTDEYRFPYPYEGVLYSDFGQSNTARANRDYFALMSDQQWQIRLWEQRADWRAEVYCNEGGFVVYPADDYNANPQKMRFKPLVADPIDLGIFTADPRNLMKVSEEYSEGDLFAAEIVGKPSNFDTSISIMLALPENTGKIQVFGNTTVRLLKEEADIREMPDGKSYLMITGEQWLNLGLWGHTLDAENQRVKFDASSRWG